MEVYEKLLGSFDHTLYFKYLGCFVTFFHNTNGQQNSLSVELWWQKIEGNLRWANTEPPMDFRRANTERSMDFRNANTEPSMHFRRANTEPSMHFRKANTETY